MSAGQEIGEAFRPTKCFVVKYTDECDPASFGSAEWRCFAFDAEHAEMKFLESEDSDGWKILSVGRPRDSRGKVSTKYDREAA